MKKEEITENEDLVVKNNEQVEESTELAVQDFSSMKTNSKSKKKIYTNITDSKKIFNLESQCDFRINDCKGQLIRVKEVLLKIIEKPLDKPEIDEETGEVLKDKDIKMITILIDDNDKSYVTGSKLFTLDFMKYIEMFGLKSIEKGLEIEIIERPLKNSVNKALGFKLV